MVIHRDMHPAMPVKSRLLRCLSFGPKMVLTTGVAAPAAVPSLLRASSRRAIALWRCPRTGDDLDVVSLLLDYMSMKSGDPGGI